MLACVARGMVSPGKEEVATSHGLDELTVNEASVVCRDFTVPKVCFHCSGN